MKKAYPLELITVKKQKKFYFFILQKFLLNKLKVIEHYLVLQSNNSKQMTILLAYISMIFAIILIST